MEGDKGPRNAQDIRPQTIRYAGRETMNILADSPARKLPTTALTSRTQLIRSPTTDIPYLTSSDNMKLLPLFPTMIRIDLDKNIFIDSFMTRFVWHLSAL